MPDAVLTNRDRLRDELRRIRVRASLSGQRLGERLGRRQATISRIERGETVPSVDTVRAWLVACAADPPTVERLVGLAETVQAESRGWNELLDRDGHAQLEAAEMEQAATRIRVFQPTVVPGLLQTPEYARLLFGLGRTRDVAAAVAARVERQQVLYEPGRRFEFLITEAALRWPLGGENVHTAQLDRVLSLAKLPAVSVTVLPADAVVAPAWHNFILWSTPDEPERVTAELVAGERDTSDPDVVGWHEQLWARICQAALDGAEARSFISRLGSAGTAPSAKARRAATPARDHGG